MDKTLRTSRRADGIVVRRREARCGLRYTTYELHEDVFKRLDSFGEASRLSQRASRKLTRLSRRKAALAMLAKGEAPKVIAYELGISAAAVRNYKSGRR